MAEKQDRCWPGYEAVQGKKPNSQGSCRPKAESKSTPSEKNFRAKRKKQLDNWQETHGGKRQAAQHLAGPGNEPSSQKGAAKKKIGAKKTAAKKSVARKSVAKNSSATKRASARKQTPRKAA